tara:strand:+ start:301 stop:564 length:264 start_codon:yes stop_codon:yes gene_type:complete
MLIEVIAECGFLHLLPFLLRKKIAGIAVERCGDPTKHSYRRVPPASLDPTEVGEIDLRIMRQLLLRQLSLGAPPPDICSNDPVPIHR